MTRIYCEIMEDCYDIAEKERKIDNFDYWSCKKHLRMSETKIKYIWEREGMENQKNIDKTKSKKLNSFYH